MQAVLLAAGESSRFWPLNHKNHKSFYSVLDEPIILHSLKSFS